MEILIPMAALGALGAVFGALLGVAAKAFKIEKDERADKVMALLPGANCGGCGLAGCAAMAEALVGGKTELTACAVLKKENAQQIALILGIEAPGVSPVKARILCSGSCDAAGISHDYDGLSDCIAAARYGGEKACLYSCLGYGNCVRVCSFGALTVTNGLAVVDDTRCTGCGACVAACPRKLIELVPVEHPVYVACSSRDSGAVVKNICKVGCVACKICEKNCPTGAVTVTDNLASVSSEKCINCGICIDKCPKHVIQYL